MEKKNINRRDFLMNSLKTVAAGSLVYSTIDLKNLFAIETESVSSIQKVINLSDYPALGKVGGYAMITGSVIVIRTGQKNFIALKTICTHKKCDVEFNGKEFECPCHGSKYNKSGKVLNGPAKKSLTSYKTTYDSEKNTLTINM
jgi:cytochrome b6-f complex iron-sulfur subunit